MSQPQVPPPRSVLGRHRLLAPTASVMVSPICLGAMNFGDMWKDILGECDKDTVFSILDYFYSMGGNFIDTASNYQGEQSEQWLGEWLSSRGCRDEMVIATKYCGAWKGYSEPDKMQSNFGGSGSKNMRLAVEGSLKKLQTDYIDLYYVHVWDQQTSIPELMQSLNHLVVSGKVLYLGISDTPAWVVSKCNEYARQNGLRQFSVYQGWWNAGKRDFERDILPMCKSESMGICPWGALGSGNFKAKNVVKEGGRNFDVTKSANDEKISEVLEKIANRKNTAITSVALAYVMHKAPYVFPICGGRKIEHLRDNILALSLELSQDDIDEIEGSVPFHLGFPHDLLGGGKVANGPGDVKITSTRGHFDWVRGDQPIPPPQNVVNDA